MNREDFQAEQNSTPNKIVLNKVIKRTEQNRTDIFNYVYLKRAGLDKPKLSGIY